MTPRTAGFARSSACPHEPKRKQQERGHRNPSGDSSRPQRQCMDGFAMALMEFDTALSFGQQCLGRVAPCQMPGPLAVYEPALLRRPDEIRLKCHRSPSLIELT
jgi:hypothetical protein